MGIIQARLSRSGSTVPLVGYVSAFPRHPELDTAVTPFADDPVTAVEGAHALVRVQWATKVTTITQELVIPKPNTSQAVSGLHRVRPGT